MQSLDQFLFRGVLLMACQMAVIYYHHGSAKNLKKDNNFPTNEGTQSLKTALSRNRLFIWNFKDRSALSHVITSSRLLKSAVSNSKNQRLARALEKVLRGENVRAVVYGGSNTAGGGLQDDEHSVQGRFFDLLSQWWSRTITPATGSRLEITTIGMGGTSSTFFQFCHQAYLEDDEHINLAILETSVNDFRAIKLPYSNRSLPLEQLSRQLLKGSDNLAVIFVNFFTGDKKACSNLMDFGQGRLCDRYEITTLELRNLVCDHKRGKLFVKPSTSRFLAKDRKHMSLLGHVEMALIMIELISSTLAKLMNPGKNLSALADTQNHPSSRLPSPVYIKGRGNTITRPLCWTTVTSNYKEKIIHNSLHVSIVRSKGFSYVENVLIGGLGYSGTVYRTDAFDGWLGTKKKSEITLGFSLTKAGKEEVRTLRSVGIALRTIRMGGRVEVWLDDRHEERVKIPLDIEFRQTLVRMVAKHANTGEHTLTIRIIKSGVVPIVGVVVGPPDGPF